MGWGAPSSKTGAILAGSALSGWPVEALGEGQEPGASGDDEGYGYVRVMRKRETRTDSFSASALGDSRN
jgi:hypothetical protein